MASGCRGCGGGGAGPSVDLMARHVDTMRQNTEGMVTMNAADMTMVKVIDGNTGSHPIVGAITKTFYGYRKDGAEFLMHKDDVAAMPKTVALALNDEAPADETPADEAPADEAPADEAPAAPEAPADEVAAAAALADEVVVKPVATKATATKATTTKTRAKK